MDVAAATGRLRDLGLPEVVEWVDETTPGLRDAVQDEGSLSVEELPLMVLDGAGDGGPHRAAARRAGAAARPRGPGGGRGRAGRQRAGASAAPARPAGTRAPASGTRACGRRSSGCSTSSREGAVRMAVAESDAQGVLATGRTLPIDGVTEVMGVATLPAARRPVWARPSPGR